MDLAAIGDDGLGADLDFAVEMAGIATEFESCRDSADDRMTEDSGSAIDGGFATVSRVPNSSNSPKTQAPRAI